MRKIESIHSVGLIALFACGVMTAEPAFSPIRIRCAGPSYTDPMGHVWSADPGYEGGAGSVSTVPIAGTHMQPLYQSSRSWTSSPGAYTFTVPNGTYHVVLKFAETTATQAGQRVFNVSINNQSVLTNFDILASAGGANIAVNKQYPVAVSSGEIDIAFAGVTGAAMVSAIEITAAAAQSPYEVQTKFQPEKAASQLSLPDIPMVGTLRVYRNGLLLSDRNDYFMSDDQLWFQPPALPQNPDLIVVMFRH